MTGTDPVRIDPHQLITGTDAHRTLHLSRPRAASVRFEGDAG